MIPQPFSRLTPTGGALRPATLAWIAAALAVGLAAARLPLPYVAALGGAAAVVVLTLIYPLIGLAAALVLGPFGALENVILGGTALDSGQLALLLTLAAWVAAGLARRRLVVPRTPLNLPLAIFLFVAGLTLLDAYSVTLGLLEVIKWLEVALIIWLIVDSARDPWRRTFGQATAARLVLAALLLAGLVQAAVGIWQFGLRGDGPEHFIIMERFYRAYGTFEQPNPFGGYMNLTAMLAAGTALGLGAALLTRRATDAESWLRPAWLWLGGAAVCFVAASAALVFSWSRGAWLGYLAGVGVLVVFGFRRLRVGLLVAALIALLGAVAILGGRAAGFGPAASVAARLGGFADEFTPGDVRGVDINDANYAVLERLAHWQAAVDMARDDLWTGVGFGGYAAAYPQYALVNWPDALGHAHNYYLNLLAEVGLPGLLAYLFLWLAVVWYTVRLVRGLAWPERGVAVGLLAAWAALSVHQLVDKLYVNNIYVHLGAMLGLLCLLEGLAARRRLKIE